VPEKLGHHQSGDLAIWRSGDLAIGTIGRLLVWPSAHPADLALSRFDRDDRPITRSPDDEIQMARWPDRQIAR